MILIIGRSGSGKDTLMSELRKKLGFTVVKSYTTRPKRFPEEDTHIFITPEEASEAKDKVAITVINGNEYFATRQQVEEADAYIIDPVGAYMLAENMPDATFPVIYCIADNDARMHHAVARATDANAEKHVYKKRDRDEAEQFDVFEDLLFNHDGTWRRDGVKNPVYVFRNNYTPECMDKFINHFTFAEGDK